ncbi:MAG: sodium/solute symporter [Candidatus Aminicenantes bacterium]|nr:sodium/solute symporter [Candidatus Aminicenantes bacterium]
MTILDWIIIAATVVLVIYIGYRLSRRQRDEIDYFLAGRRIRGWPIGLSLLANQVSAISLVGAPAFIAVKTGGGLRWLQYELAVPLAMAAIIVFLLPLYRRSNSISIYHYLEKRFGRTLRLMVTVFFLLSRSLGSGVVLLATAYVISVCLDISLLGSLVAIALVTLVYTTMGGIMADIYTDIIQLAILWTSALICVIILVRMLGGIPAPLISSAPGRYAVIVTSGGAGSTFSFWPMLLGGFFLYLSYYGCDQSQAQRLLTSADHGQARQALLINGLLRFPIVATYCLIGFLMIPFLASRPAFAAQIVGLPPDYIMPHFFRSFVPSGFLGFVIAGIFAASLSSLDSALNSLSAVSWNDVLLKLKPGLNNLQQRKKLLVSRLLTFLWGGTAFLAAWAMADSGETVIEIVNKIGSAFYGPIAAVFMIGILAPQVKERAALSGLLAGFGANIYLWAFQSSTVSWLWWNVAGFGITSAVALALSHGGTPVPGYKPTFSAGLAKDRQAVLVMAVWSALIMSLLLALQIILSDR